MKRVMLSLFLTAGVAGGLPMAQAASALAIPTAQAAAASASNAVAYTTASTAQAAGTSASTVKTAGTAAAAQPTVVKRPLPQIFDQLVIVPYDYHGKVFVDGRKIDLAGNYAMAERNEHVLVPIRLLSTLVSAAAGTSGRDWTTQWHKQHPNDVYLVNSGQHKTVKFTAGSRSMLVNGQPMAMDTAALEIGGRLMLPIRSAAEALGVHIDWLNGLMIVGNDYVNLQDPQTLAVQTAIKAELTDARKPVQGGVWPVAQYGQTIYYAKSDESPSGAPNTLFRKTGDGTVSRIPLSGKPDLARIRQADGNLYFLSVINQGQAALFALNLANGQVARIGSFPWDSMGGWLGDVRVVNDQTYVDVHIGDITNGGDALYRIDGGTLVSLVNTDNIIQYAIDGGKLYYTDYHPMSDTSNNLWEVDLTTGKVSRIGRPDYVYGMIRQKDSQDAGLRFAGQDDLAVRNGSLYVLGYPTNGKADPGALYRIDLADRSQEKIRPQTEHAWLVNDQLYSVDADSGYLVRTDLNGSTPLTVVQRSVEDVRFVNGDFYYTASADGKKDNIGQLYRYDPAAGQEVRLSAGWVSSYYVGQSQIYYVAKGYRPGIYKVNANGHTTALVQDDIGQAVFSESGVLYTLKYKNGSFTTK